MYINSFLRYLTNEKRCSKHTVRSYSSDLEQFVSFNNEYDSDFNPLRCDHQIIRKWIIFLMENGKSPRTVNRKITTLKSFFKFLYREGKIETIPTDKVVLPKMNKPLPHFVSKSTMNILFDQFEFTSDFEGVRDRTIMLMFYCTGMRLSELVNLTTNNVDLTLRQFKVLGKRNKERIIPFNIELKLQVEIYLKERANLSCPHNKVFVSCKGEPVYDKLVYRLVNKYLTAITTLEKRSPHILRHTFATQMLNSGADINAIKELLGHANLSATQIYTHTTFEKLKQIYNQAHPRA